MKPKSIAWSYFARDEQNSTASCIFCGQTFKIPTSGTTTNLINHLRDKHRPLLAENHPHLIPVPPELERFEVNHSEHCAAPASSERSSPDFNEELIKAEPMEEPIVIHEEPVRHVEHLPETERKRERSEQREQVADQPTTSGNPATIQPPLKRTKLLGETLVSSTSITPKFDEYKVLGNFVSSELRSAAEIDPTLAMKASIAIQEALLNLKKDIMFRNTT